MQADEIKNKVGKPIKDIYGRYMGFIAGYSVDGSGKLIAVGIDEGQGQFSEYLGTRLVLAEEGPAMLPAWKVDTEGLGQNGATIRKRLEALKGLAKEGEVPPHIYEEMTNEYSTQLKSLDDSYAQLSQTVAKRVRELDADIESIDRFLVNIKVQHRSGEVDEQTFKSVSDNCGGMKARNLQEKEELVRLVKSISELVAPRITVTVPPSREKAAATTN